MSTTNQSQGSNQTGGLKYDQGKPDFTYLSYEFLEEMAKVREFGAKKYSRSNWKKGFKITRSLAAALRHIFSFLRGETNDPESGLCHLAHAACCLEHAIYDLKHHPENDDRDTVDEATRPQVIIPPGVSMDEMRGKGLPITFPNCPCDDCKPFGSQE